MTHPIVGAASVLALSLAPIFIADRDQLRRLLEEHRSASSAQRRCAKILAFPKSRRESP